MYSAAVAILERIGHLAGDVNEENEEEIRNLAKQLEEALEQVDDLAVQPICEELDDIFFDFQQSDRCGVSLPRMPCE